MISSFKTIVLLLILFFIIVGASDSQQDIESLYSAIDSLEGKTKVDSLIKISEYYSLKNARRSSEISQLVIKESKELNYREGIQQGLHNLAIAYYYLYEFNKSLEYYFEEINYIDTTDLFSLVRVYNNVGAIYDLLNKQAESIEYYKKGLTLLNRHENKEFYAATSVNLALVYGENSEFDSALVYLKKSYKVASETNFSDKSLKAHIKVNMAELYTQMGEYKLAFEAIHEVQKHEENMTDIYIKQSVNLILGGIYHGMEMYPKAEDALQKVIKLTKENSSTEREMEAHKKLSEIYFDWGKSKRALEQLEIYNEIKDSVFKLDKSRQILEIEQKYESEKQQKEIELLEKETALAKSRLAQSKMRNTFYLSIALLAIIVFIFIYKDYRYKNKSNKELGKINEYLVSSEVELHELNSMKDNLIRIIGQDLKSPLTSVLGFSELLSQGKFMDDTEKTKKFLDIIRDTSLSINQLLDNILYWARLQRDGYEINKTMFNVRNAILEGAEPYQGIAVSKNIEVDLEVDDDLTIFGDEFICSVVVGNLISNALKYSYPNSNILVKVEDSVDGAYFSIIDKGIGIGPDAYKSLFEKHVFNSTLGTKNEKGTGFGLKICKQFIELNGGNIWVESEVGKGTTVRFSMPKESV